MELNRIIELMNTYDTRNQCEYSLSVSTRDWLGKRETISSILELSGPHTTRTLRLHAGTTEADLIAFFEASDVQKTKLARLVESRAKLDAEIAAMGGETIICNEVKS